MDKMTLKWTDVVLSTGTKHPYHTAAYLLCTLLTSLELVISPLILIKLVNLIYKKKYRESILLLFVVGIVFLVVDVLDSVVSTRIQHFLMASTQQQVVEYITHPSNVYSVDDGHRGTWTYNTTEYAWQINQFLDTSRRLYIRSAIFLLGSSILLRDKKDKWSIVLLLIQTAAVAIFPWIIFNQINFNEFREVSRKNDEVFDYLDDTFQNRKTVVGYDMVKHTVHKLHSKADYFFQAESRLTNRLYLQLILPTGIFTVVTFAVIIIRYTNRNDIVENTFELTKYFLNIFQRIFHVGVMLQVFIPLLCMYSVMLDLEEKLVKPDLNDTVRPMPLITYHHIDENQGLCFHEVSFAYSHDKNDVLSGLKLNFPAKSTTALVGQSGTGKTTILNLIKGFQIPTKGYITLHGTDLSIYPERNLVVGYVMQHPQIFNTKVWENVGYGLPELNREYIEARLNTKGLLPFLAYVGLDLNDDVGKNGDKLSGGQRQIVQLLRVLLLDPIILLLDEPTAALDKERSERVMELICRSTSDKIVIMVTHDLSLLKYMSRIIDVNKIS